MKDYDELIDFVENNLGIKLLPYQKILLKILENMNNLIPITSSWRRICPISYMTLSQAFRQEKSEKN